MIAGFALLNVTWPHYNIMSGLFRKGWSSRAVQTFMSENVKGYRRTTVLAAQRKALDTLKFESYYDKLSPTKYPSKARIPELTWNRVENYKIMFRYDRIDKETGEVTRHLGSMYTDSFMTSAGYRRVIDEELKDLEDKYAAFTANIRVQQVIHHADRQW